MLLSCGREGRWFGFACPVLPPPLHSVSSSFSPCARSLEPTALTASLRRLPPVPPLPAPTRPNPRFSRKATGVPAFVILSAGVAAIPLAVRPPTLCHFLSSCVVPCRTDAPLFPARMSASCHHLTSPRLATPHLGALPQRTATELALVSALLGVGNGLSAGISSTLAADFAPPAPATGAFLVRRPLFFFFFFFPFSQRSVVPRECRVGDSTSACGEGPGLCRGTIESLLKASLSPSQNRKKMHLAPPPLLSQGVWRVITDGGSMLGPVLGGWLKQRFRLERAALCVGAAGLLGAAWLSFVVRACVRMRAPRSFALSAGHEALRARGSGCFVNYSMVPSLPPSERSGVASFAPSR